MRKTITWLICSAVLALGAGCTEEKAATIGTKETGESCGQASECKAGNECIEGTCTLMEPLVTGPQRGDPCMTNSDCGMTLVCGRQDVCTFSEGLEVGELCGLTIDCVDPLVCGGLSSTCEMAGGPGTADLGEACTEILDCRRPFICDLTNQCAKIPFYIGPVCTRSDEEAGVFRVHWETPPATPANDDEFYRHPFPSDLRKDANGQIVMDGHPAPDDVLGIDVPGLFFGTIHDDADGYATNAPIFFRFSDIVDNSSLCLTPGSIYPPKRDLDLPDYCSDPAMTGRTLDPNIMLVNIDPNDMVDYGQRIPVQMAESPNRGQYICQNWLGVAPLDGQPLKQSTTYAAVITTGLLDIRGDRPIQDQAFAAAMADDTGPMELLIDWLESEGIARNTIAGATVFTTGDADAVAPLIRAAVHGTTVPDFNPGEVTCQGAVVSLCDDGLTGMGHTRGCFGQRAGLWEIQGTYPNPVLQAGTRPYLQSTDGGNFEYGMNGQPIVQDTETMCFAVTVPRGVPPPGGFPVVIYGHGTGGNYRGFVDRGDPMVPSVAEILIGEGYAVIGFDNVMHGPRQQPPNTPPTPLLWQDPGNLFFNLLNPRASRDNILQGSADLFQLVRLVRNPAATLNGPDGTISFDASEVYYLGHSQGTVIAPAFLTAESDIRAAVFSGAGAELALSILNKKEPADLSVLAGSLFADQSLTRVHPMMGILAHLFAPADAISYAHTWVAEPIGSPLPFMMFSGIGDNFTPDVTHDALILAAGIPQVGMATRPVGLPASSPQVDNLNGVTAGTVQFTNPTGGDGHFVMFDSGPARITLRNFFSTARTGSPEIQK